MILLPAQSSDWKWNIMAWRFSTINSTHVNNNWISALEQTRNLCFPMYSATILTYFYNSLNVLFDEWELNEINSEETVRKGSALVQGKESKNHQENVSTIHYPTGLGLTKWKPPCHPPIHGRARAHVGWRTKSKQSHSPEAAVLHRKLVKTDNFSLTKSSISLHHWPTITGPCFIHAQANKQGELAAH